jgi:hypothetical protein
VQRTIIFRTAVPIRQDYVTDDTEFSFGFDVIDPSLIGEPEEISSASHHKIRVVIAYELLINWQLDEASRQDLIKVLFHYARRQVEEKVRNGTLQEREVLRLSIENRPEKRCPLDISRIPDPIGFVSRVDVDDLLSRPESKVDTYGEHPNITVLMKRMDDALARGDYAGVLHSSASVFETMAKDIVGIPTVQDQTLKGFFDRYRKDSALPTEILDYILAVYDRRNVTPLAGHGSTQTPNMRKEDAITLAEMTRAFVRIEYGLRR